MSGILGWIFKSVLEFVTAKIAAMVALYQKDKANHQANVDQAAQDTQKAKEITKDSGAKDVDSAIDDTLSHF